MLTSRHRGGMALVFLSLLLSACDGVLTSLSSSSESDVSSTPSIESYVDSSSVTPSSVPLTSIDIDFFFSQINLPPYLTEDTPLPIVEGLEDAFSWESPDLLIENNILRYANPIYDETKTLFVTLTYEGRSYQRAIPIVMKSQLLPPTLAQKASLNIQLSNAFTEIDIVYESTLDAALTLSYDRNGQRMSQDIASPLTIRTRGHSTRYMPKRSYRIRFDENTSLLGMKSAKNYILLANYIDHSQVRNALIHFMSRFYDSLYPIDYRFVDLSFNGVYQGNYLLTERVEFHKNRLDIPFVPAATNSDSGFLVELDYPGVEFMGEGTEGVDMFRLEGRPYQMKEPNLDTPGFEARHFNFIRTTMENVTSRLKNRQDVSALIDIDNWVDYFLLQEISKNVDVGWGSVYVYKAPNEPLRHGPLWDFDISMGLGNYFDSDASGHWGWNDYFKNDFFTWMMQQPTIYARFRQRLTDFETRVLPYAIAFLTEHTATFSSIFQNNIEKWPLNICEGGFCPMVEPLLQVSSYADHLEFIEDFLIDRVAWMKANIPS